MEVAIDKRILLRMRKELKDLETSPPLGVVCYPLNDNIVHLQAEISGPEDTPYSTGIFKIDILIPDRYPFEPPRCQFQTRVYHPNIDEQGRICLDILKSPPKGSWGPAISISTMLISLRLLLATPNPDDPLLVEVANEFKENRELFLLKAKEYTERYATGSEDSLEGKDDAEASFLKGASLINGKFIPSRACELQEPNASSPTSAASCTFSRVDQLATSLSTPSHSAFPSLAFSGSSLPQAKVHSGLAEKRTLKKPALKKPTLGSIGPTEGTVSTAAAMPPITTSISSKTIQLPIEQEAAGNDNLPLIAASDSTNFQKAIEQPRLQTHKESLERSLHPSAEDTVAATDLSVAQEIWEHEYTSLEDMAVAADSTMSDEKVKHSQPNAEDMDSETDSKPSSGSWKHKVVSVPSKVSIEIEIPKRTKHSKGTTRSKLARRPAAPGTDTLPIVASETQPRSGSGSAITSGTLSSRLEEINCSSPAIEPSEHTTCKVSSTPSSKFNFDGKPQKAPSPPLPSRVEPSRSRHGSDADLDQPLVISRHFTSSSQVTECEPQKRPGGGKDVYKGQEKDKSTGKGKRRVMSVIDVPDPGSHETEETDENAGAGSMSYYNQRDDDLYRKSVGATPQMVKAAPEWNSGSAPPHPMAPLTIARKRNLLKKQRTSRPL
ncbi:Ubiquitin-conjugating enzyme E2 T [Mortierella alpina]|nr:Ubiquitin-conjugating enzyme E2 T [Mortierella alpina]